MSARTSPPIVLAAGGTGGHVFPAEAVASALIQRGYRPILVTDRRGAAFGGVLGTIETYRLAVGALSGGPAAKLGGGIALARSLFAARALLRALRPAAAVGFGGYPSLPTLIAALLAHIPTAIHEQNAVLGRANRLLARWVDAVATSFAEVQFLAAARATLTGNPVRPAFLAARNLPYVAPQGSGRIGVLVTGGSQGAGVFAKVVPEAIAALPPALRPRLDVVQQCRPEDLAATRAAYGALGVSAELAAFFDDLPTRLALAQIAICRAGASSVAELATVGRPAILVPYPFATDDHQAANARALEKGGGAWVIPAADFTPRALADRLIALLADPGALARAAAAAQGLGRPDAGERLADLMARLAPANGGTDSESFAREAA
ncbi:MAG: undecaprenyldiphospho-muramoylpentapeptide beta-N-acetylglucosaminyltransferase [Pseudomonadota bacterium]